MGRNILYFGASTGSSRFWMPLPVHSILPIGKSTRRRADWNRDTFTYLTKCNGVVDLHHYYCWKKGRTFNMRVATFFFVAGCLLSLDAFNPTMISKPPTRAGSSASASSSSSVLFAGGFGGGGGASTNNNNKVDKKKKASSKQIKLKPKQQWDRYIALKGTTKIPVGVRMKEDETEEWIKVGYVRSKEDEYTEISVATQRALIAEVSWIVRIWGG